MKDLIERLERAEEGSRELDREIANHRGIEFEQGRGADESTLPRYTRSIDTAMALVPEGWSVSTGHLPGRDWIVRAHLRDHRPKSLTKEGHSHIWLEGHSKTFALALCIAALKAIAQALKEQSNG